MSREERKRVTSVSSLKCLLGNHSEKLLMVEEGMSETSSYFGEGTVMECVEAVKKIYKSMAGDGTKFPRMFVFCLQFLSKSDTSEGVSREFEGLCVELVKQLLYLSRRYSQLSKLGRTFCVKIEGCDVWNIYEKRRNYTQLNECPFLLVGKNGIYHQSVTGGEPRMIGARGSSFGENWDFVGDDDESFQFFEDRLLRNVSVVRGVMRTSFSQDLQGYAHWVCFRISGGLLVKDFHSGFYVIIDVQAEGAVKFEEFER